MRKLLLSLLAFGGLLSLGTSAAAVTILGFEPGQSFTESGMTITFVRVDTGPQAGTYESAGTIGATDVVLVFQATADSDDFDSVGVGMIECDPGPFFTIANCGNFFGGVNSTGAGAGPDDDPEVDIASIGGNAGLRIFNFDGNLETDPDETSDEFFVAFAAGDIDEGGTFHINFMISPVGGSDVTVAAQFIPEPTTVLMLGLGLGGLAVLSRRHH